MEEAYDSQIEDGSGSTGHGKTGWQSVYCVLLLLHRAGMIVR